jgi:hypothetical protein
MSVGMSSSDIERASFDEIADGAVDAAQVKRFLVDVASQVRELERNVQEAHEMRAAAMELVTQAEALVDQVKDRAAFDPGPTAEEAERLIADAESRAQQIEAAAAARVRAAEAQMAETLQRSKSDAAAIVRESERVATQLIEEVQSEHGWRRIEAAATAAAEQESVRLDAAKERELARVDAVAIVADAREHAGRVEQQISNDSASAPGQAEFDRIVAEAEALLEAARTESKAIVAAATERAADADDVAEYTDDVRPSTSALQSVANARTREAASASVSQARDRALQMLVALRRGDDRIPADVRAELAEELHELQDLIIRLEDELLEHGTGTRMIVDLTDGSADDSNEPVTARPSRYQQRSANLPKIGSQVENVNRAMRSMRDHMKDSD